MRISDWSSDVCASDLPFGRDDAPDIKTSDVKATVNLNAGSVTLGNIVGQRDAEMGAFLTDTVLNLNGSGFLGADFLNLKTQTSPTYPPDAVLPKDAQELGFRTYSIGAVRTLGVISVTKDDAGLFFHDISPTRWDNARVS